MVVVVNRNWGQPGVANPDLPHFRGSMWKRYNRLSREDNGLIGIQLRLIQQHPTEIKFGSEQG